MADSTKEEWQRALSALIENLTTYRKNVVTAQDVLCWESNEDDFYEFLGRPKTVTFLSWRDLSKYQRFIRMARTLMARGCSVKFLFVSTDPDCESRIRDVGVQGVHYRWVAELTPTATIHEVALAL